VNGHRIAVISDTHNLLRPEVAEVIKTCEVVLHGGDISGPQTLEMIRGVCGGSVGSSGASCQVGGTGNFYVVRGNNDRGFWAQKLQNTLSFSIEGVRFFMVHDRRDAGRACFDADVVVFGHTHNYFQETMDGQLWLNPGSCGYSRFGLPPTMALMEISQGDFTVKQIVLSSGR
jgi:putative phosphoesterase